MSIFAVEITGRFIREKQRWPVRQTARDGDALTLAAGKFGRKMIESMLEANQLQQFESARRVAQKLSDRFRTSGSARSRPR